MTADDSWVVVHASRRRWECHERAFVLDAIGIPNHIADGPRMSARLLVPVTEADRALRELDSWERENRARTPARGEIRWHGHGVAGVFAYFVVLLTCFWLQTREWLGADWVEAGLLHGRSVRDGEWWRIVTALTLHADGGHLSANLIFGAFFGAFAGQYLGSGFAWATILLAAAAGNAMDVLLLPAYHRALGASTAVFAALGVVSAFIWAAQKRQALSWARRWAPVVGAVVLLAWIGTGDAQTDTVAHLTGFVCGFVVGGAWGFRPPALAAQPRLQLAVGVATLMFVAACWWQAIVAWQERLAVP